MAKTLTVEGDITAVDTRTLIQTQGSVTAPSLIVPAGATIIDQILVAASAEGLADGSAAYLLRLGGGAVLGGEQVLVIGAGGRIAPQSGSDAAPAISMATLLTDLQIAVRASDNLTISAEMAGTDLGTVHVVITLIFK